MGRLEVATTSTALWCKRRINFSPLFFNIIRFFPNFIVGISIEKTAFLSHLLVNFRSMYNGRDALRKSLI